MKTKAYLFPGPVWLSVPPGNLWKYSSPCLLLHPCLLSHSLGVGQAQESEFSMNPLRESQQMVTELANTGWNMQKKPDQMLGDSPLPPRDGFMVWVKTIKNTLVFSLVSLWVSASCDAKWNHRKAHSVGPHLPREVEYCMTRKLRTETQVKGNLYI